MNGTLKIYRNHTAIVESDGTSEPLFDDNNTITLDSYDSLSINGSQTLSFDVEVDGMENNNSFYVASDSEWAKILRNRNRVNVLIEPNYDGDYRTCNITFVHNVAQDVICVVYIIQDGVGYDIDICDDDNCGTDENEFAHEIEFQMMGKQTKVLTVRPIGGTENFKIFKPRKYVTVKVEKTDENDTDYTYDKRVLFDGAVTVKRGPIYRHNDICIGKGEYDNLSEQEQQGYSLLADENQIVLTSDGTLNIDYNDEVTDIDGAQTHNYTYNNDCYYVITVSHSDVLGVTKSVKVSFADSNDCDLPELNVETTPDDVNCEQIELLPPKIRDDNDDDIIPSIEFGDERYSDGRIEINSEDYTYIDVITVPEESLVYFKYYGNYIEDVTITHDGTKSTIGIKAKPNPYPFDRNCLGYIINAEYPEEKLKLLMTQIGDT